VECERNRRKSQASLRTLVIERLPDGAKPLALVGQMEQGAPGLATYRTPASNWGFLCDPRGTRAVDGLTTIPPNAAWDDTHGRGHPGLCP